MKCIFLVWTLDIASLKISVKDIDCLAAKPSRKGKKFSTGWINHYNLISLDWFVSVPGEKSVCFGADHPLIKKSDTGLFYLCVGMKFLSATSLPHWSCAPLRVTSGLMWNRHEGISHRQQPTHLTQGCSDSLPPMEPQRVGLKHLKGTLKAKVSLMCSGLWMWEVDLNKKEPGLVLETELNNYRVNLMLKANSSLLRWLELSAKSSQGNVSVLGIQILSFYDQILQPSFMVSHH